jgi:leucyl aminopeptidase
METNSFEFDYKNGKLLPNLTFEKREKVDNLVILLNESDLTNPPHYIKKHLEHNKTLASDIKEKKSALIYGSASDDHFIKCLVLYEKFVGDLSTANRKKIVALGAKTTRQLLEQKAYDISIHFPSDFTEDAIAIYLNALFLTNHKFVRKGKKFDTIQNVNILSLEKALAPEQKFLVDSAYYSLWAREIGNERANVATTEFVKSRVKEIQEKHGETLSVEVIEGQALVDRGLNLIYNVGKGSVTPPALIILKYNGNPKSSEYNLALVGKGILFDSGGLNIKTSQMEEMYGDKGGSCVVLSAVKGAAEQKLPINFYGLLAVAENSIGPNCYRPSDIIKSLKGLTVEIGNTDAEGRLVLADAMTYAQKMLGVKQIIELSTLTGACMVALGLEVAGLFTNNEGIAKNILKLSDIVNEPFWRLPLNDDHRDSMKSTVADLTNSGKSRYGGASNAAAFLENFVEEGTKWAHLDIAGPSLLISDKGIYRGGSSGFGVKLMLHYLKEKSREEGNILEIE